MKKILQAILVLTFISCSGDKISFDATGVFETTEITVSAEQTGKLLSLDIEEGDKVEAGVQVGIIDTVQLYLTARRIGATKLIYRNQIPETSKQIAELKQLLAKAKLDVARYEKLVKEGAAGSKLLDDAVSRQIELESKLAATESTLVNSTNSLAAQLNTADVEQLIVADKLQKCHITSPTSGIILEKYTEPGEFATVGKPLFMVANTDIMYLRAYLTAEQVTGIKVGQKVTVYADQGSQDRKAYNGEITWITAKAEFTPKTIQTRDERANLVYAVKIAVQNDGLIKSGMYGDVRLH